MKRVLSFILVLAMLIGMGPVQVLAMDTDSGLTLDSVAGDIFIEHNLAHIGVSNTMGNTSGTVLEVIEERTLWTPMWSLQVTPGVTGS